MLSFVALILFVSAVDFSFCNPEGYFWFNCGEQRTQTPVAVHGRTSQTSRW
jgi:hypothetical protein